MVVKISRIHTERRDIIRSKRASPQGWVPFLSPLSTVNPGTTDRLLESGKGEQRAGAPARTARRLCSVVLFFPCSSQAVKWRTEHQTLSMKIPVRGNRTEQRDGTEDRSKGSQSCHIRENRNQRWAAKMSEGRRESEANRWESREEGRGREVGRRGNDHGTQPVRELKIRPREHFPR